MIKNLTALAFLFISFSAFAQKNPIERIWNNQEKNTNTGDIWAGIEVEIIRLFFPAPHNEIRWRN